MAEATASEIERSSEVNLRARAGAGGTALSGGAPGSSNSAIQFIIFSYLPASYAQASDDQEAQPEIFTNALSKINACINLEPTLETPILAVRSSTMSDP